VQELIPGQTVAVAIEREATSNRRTRSDRALQGVLGARTLVWRRPDGKPVGTDNGSPGLSAAHLGDLTLAVAHPGPVGCDLEAVVTRPQSVWDDLLGPDQVALASLIAQETAEAFAAAATRVWATREALQKAGAVPGAPVVFASATPDGWVLLRAGSYLSATFLASVQQSDEPVVLAFSLRSGHAAL
jgi:enediyne polyketide synthase